MNIADKDKLRQISFREFADYWLDRLNKRYDALGELWIDTFRSEIKSEIISLGERVDKLISLLSHLNTEETIQAFIAEFGGLNEETPLPAFETILPVLRALGGKDDDSALAVIGIFKYATRIPRIRGPSGAKGDNINTD